MLLAAELWREIVGQLSAADQRTCLFVSRTHHDIAAAFLFSHIHITFGAGCEHSERLASAKDLPNGVNEMREDASSRNTRVGSQILMTFALIRKSQSGVLFMVMCAIKPVLSILIGTSDAIEGSKCFS